MLLLRAKPPFLSVTGTLGAGGQAALSSAGFLAKQAAARMVQGKAALAEAR
jgi:hypothetical protein